MKTRIFFIVWCLIILITACNPEASFYYDCVSCETGDTVHFINTSINAKTSEWDFGDGTTISEENPFHIYEVSGTFTVWLTVTNNNSSDNTSRSLNISSPQGRVVDTVVYSPSLENNLLGDSCNRDVTIYLPPDYQSSERQYPVIYLLHGYIGDDKLWFGHGYADVDLEAVMYDLIRTKIIQPMILVSADSYNRFGGSWYINSVSSGNWEDFIVQDLVQFVDEHYRTIANAGSRGIAGHSMGGYGAMMIAMKHPDIFSAAYGLSSSPLVFDPDPTSYLDFYRTVFKEIYKATVITDFSSLSWDARSTLAMSVAMTPNPTAPSFYCDYMFDSNGAFVPEVWQRQMAFDPYTAITTYKQNILQLNAIRLDCGNLDDGTIEGNIHFAAKLAQIGIENAFESYSGGHSNKLEERMATKVLPFFSTNLEQNISEYPPR